MPCTGEVSFGVGDGSVTVATPAAVSPQLSSACPKANNYSLSTNEANGAPVELRSNGIVSSAVNGTILEEPSAVITAASQEKATIAPSTSPPVAQAEVQSSSSRIRTPSTRSVNINPTLLFNALHPLPGEELDNDNWVDMCSCRVYLTQYRIIFITHSHSAACSIPLMSVESVEAKEIVGLNIICKDGRIIRVQARSNEDAINWYKKLTQITCGLRSLDDVFAFKFYSQLLLLKEKSIGGNQIPWIIRGEDNSQPCLGGRKTSHESLCKEFKHLGLRDSAWRISSANENFALCQTYPQHLIVPAAVTDDELVNMRNGRYYGRFPTVVWRCNKNGAVLLRSSQPMIGFFGMANEFDVKHYDKIRAATIAASAANGETPASSKFLIMDARSYTAAWANRAKGGGFEPSDTYADAEVAFMGLPNIHSIKYSFHQLRQLLNAVNDQNTFLQSLQSTMWLQNISCIFSATERCFNAMYFEGTSVLVHCSDGWDRTTQIVSLCMLIGDPFYRTFEGFEMLVQRQWIEFGHKFADRSGVLNADENERSPVFLQFLDCVYQLWMKNPDAFEFNRRYLLKLAAHTYSGLFSSFLFNSIKDALKAGSRSSTTEKMPNGTGTTAASETSPRLHALSIWDFLGKHNQMFMNPAYDCRRKHTSTLVLPKQMSEFELWREGYCCTQDQARINNPEESLAQSSTTTASGGLHEVSSLEKVTTLSRSQSASSLTSLEQNTHAIQPLHSTSSHLNGGIHSTSTTNYTGNYGVVARYNEATSNHSTPSNPLSGLQHQNFLDVDGLSKVPIVFEDRVVEMFRQLEGQLQSLNYAALNAHHERLLNGKLSSNSSLENGLMHGPLITHNGSSSTNLNGSIPTSTTRRVRNESIDSTSFGFEVIDEFDHCCIKRKHDSSGSSGSTFTTLSECQMLHCSGCKNQIRARIPSMTTPAAAATIPDQNGHHHNHSHHHHMEEEEEGEEEREGVEGKVAVLQLGSVEDVRCNGSQNGQLVVG